MSRCIDRYLVQLRICLLYVTLTVFQRSVAPICRLPMEGGSRGVTVSSCSAVRTTRKRGSCDVTGSRGWEKKEIAPRVVRFFFLNNFT